MPDHDLDYGLVDELDEISGDEQYVLIWCNTHRDYEWHWVPRDLVGLGKPKRPSAGLPNV